MSHRVSATWEGGYRTRLTDHRGHDILVDLPHDEGGTDTGTSALELSVVSLAGCIATIFLLVARKRRLEVRGFHAELEALRPKGAPTLTAVHGWARVATSASREEVTAALQITLRTCPVGVLFDHADIPVSVELEIEEPPVVELTETGIA